MEDFVKQNIELVRSSIPRIDDVELVVVSKFQPEEKILEAYNANQRIFAESRVQELYRKSQGLPKDIKWHFIGHLQTNKVKQLLSIENLELIQSVDSTRLLDAIDHTAAEYGITTHILIEINVTQDANKTGMHVVDTLNYFKHKGYHNLKATHIHGIMGMASNSDDRRLVQHDFIHLKRIFDEIRNMCEDLNGFNTLSMGMSGDYLLAIEEGSNMVRIGSLIFGDRKK